MNEKERISALEVALNNELTVRDNRLNEIQQAATAKESELTILRQDVIELKRQLKSASENLSQAVSGYHKMAVKANPEIAFELITGETIEAIENAVASAGKLVGKVKEKLVAVQTQAKVPAGAPQRNRPDFSGLSPREKIQQGIGGRRG